MTRQPDEDYDVTIHMTRQPDEDYDVIVHYFPQRGTGGAGLDRRASPDRHLGDLG